MRSTSVKVAVALFALQVFLVCAPCASAQGGVCALRVAQSPTLRGLRLGMTAAQFGQRYPRLPALKANEFGQAKTNFGGLREADEAAFEGVETLQVNFVDDRLVEFTVYYNGAPFDSMDQFMAKLGESFKVPGAWAGEGYGVRTLSCDGFRMEVGANSYAEHWLSPYIRFRENGAEDVVAKRAEEKRERQRRAFKP